MRYSLLAAMALGMWATAAAAQDAPAQTGDEPVDLGDVVVDGRPLEAQARDFVEGVANPARARGLARWAEAVCIGVVNFRRETGQQIADTMVALADEFGVPVEVEACEPDIYIIGAVEARDVARHWVARRRYDFRPRLPGINSSEIRPSMRSLDLFTGSDEPVRWYSLSLPSEPSPSMASPLMRSAPRVDDLWRVYVIVDIEGVADRPIRQICEYIAMVSFSQIHMEADTSGLPSVLNMFEGGAAGLTDWDRAYLSALYASDLDRMLNAVDHARGIADQIRSQPPQ